MSLLVVLVRHGMAEPATEEVTDEFRMLTNDGREALRESFSQTFSTLRVPDRTRGLD